MSTIITILIIAIIAALLIVGLKETIKHSKGEGACCGGGAMKEDEEATVQLRGEIVTRADVPIDGMHCMNCTNSGLTWATSGAPRWNRADSSVSGAGFCMYFP